MDNIYIIGDVHGCYKTLLALVEKLPKNAKICFVGDLIDRGKNSRDIIEFVKSNKYDCVYGNHEYFMVESHPYINIDNENKTLKRWIEKGGGLATIQNYSNRADMLDHVNYLKSVPIYKEYKDYKTNDGRYLVVSHSAIGKAWELRNSKNEDDAKQLLNHALWSRNKHSDNKDIFNVYGHTILEEVYINEYNANIDLGCYTTNKVPNPRLCALEFPTMKIITQKNIED
jgi:serine/threonine protein phosphatase 1